MSIWLQTPGLLIVPLALLAVGSLQGANCRFADVQQFGGGEPPLIIDAACTDPDYNQTTFVIDSTQQQALKLPDGSTIAYTEVEGHFPATRTVAQLPAGILESPTTVSNAVTWRFPDKAHWHNRFFQQSYPLPFEFLNTVDGGFAFLNGGYTVGITPGAPDVGYRVSAASAKLAKEYANKLYQNTVRVYGYLYGQSGGSVQVIGATEGTTGVWDGIIAVVIATDGLNTHSFMWNGLFALAVPEAKRDAIGEAAEPGSGADIYTGLDSGQRAVVNELLNAGFARPALGAIKFNVASALQFAGAIETYDPSYEDDFWSRPGYEGINPPAYVAAAKVDGYATISEITRNAENSPTAITFDPATLPALGSTGGAGLQFYVYRADGSTRVIGGSARSLAGNLKGSTLTLTGSNDPTLLKALVVGQKIRINNRLLLAACFYPRHSILDDGNPAYNQYKSSDGTPRYAQRLIQTAYLANIRASGGRLQTGKLGVKTIAIEDLVDPLSYPYVAAFYATKVNKAMGSSAADLFRIYYNENSGHGAVGPIAPGKPSTMTISIDGILNQALLDLAAWAERGIPPPPSSQYKLDTMNQIILPDAASERHGLQPLVHLTANGKTRTEAGVNQPINLAGTVEMPPGTGKVVQYDWYLGKSDFTFEPVTKLADPQTLVSVTRSISFSVPGEYIVTLRTLAQREGATDSTGKTPLQNLARVRVVVR